MANETILQTKNLKKYFGSVHAVEDVSLNVSRGKIFGFLGPNGAGKTTTIGMILGLLHPSAGSVRVFGEPVSPGQTKALKQVGSLVGAPSLVPYLSARDNLKLVARLSPNLANGQIDEALDRVGLSGAADRKAGKFSTGMKQRLGLAMALLHQPELLILDEPTNGMDPAGMREVRILLRELSDQGVTIFLSSHLLHEIEQVCDQVAVLNRGRIITQGRVADLLGKGSRVKVQVEHPSRAARILEGLPEAVDIEPNGSYLTVGGVSGQSVIRHLVAHDMVPNEVIHERIDLESLFLDLTQAEA